MSAKCGVGFTVVVVADACRGIDVAGSVEETRRVLSGLDLLWIDAATLG